MAHILVDIAPELYGPYITYKNLKSELYMELLKALYGVLFASLLSYQKSKKYM